MSDRQPLKLRAARWAGTLVRVTRRPGLALPGLAGAALASIGVGQVAGHVFHRGLTWWVAAIAGGAFLIKIGSELNAAPPAPRREDDGS